MFPNLKPEKAFIFRIVHQDNVPWILDHGLDCRNSSTGNPHYRNIGSPDLIAKRNRREVPIPPGGTLSDYIPFYFTPSSIMLYNIRTGWGGVPSVTNEEIVILVSSLHRLAQMNIPFLFTNQHAYLVMARYFDTLEKLDQIDWEILQRRDFRHDLDDPGKKERYQAEALVHRHLPLGALMGIVCHSAQAAAALKSRMDARSITLQTVVRPNWYF